MCECIKEIEALLKKEFVNEHPEVAENVEPKFENKAFMMQSKTPIRLYAESITKYKNGSKTKTWRRMIAFTYCPFCGSEYPK